MLNIILRFILSYIAIVFRPKTMNEIYCLELFDVLCIGMQLCA